MTDQNYTHISFLLDRSGSMESIKEATIAGFNAFLKEQKEVAGKCTITLAQFNHNYQRLIFMQALAEARPLTGETYAPSGTTALLDGIGKLINETGGELEELPDEQRPGKVVFVILTDGLENSSREFSMEQISSMIDLQTQAYNWKFVFLGANQDAIATADKINIPSASAMTFQANSRQANAAMFSTSEAVKAYRINQDDDPKFSEEDRKKQS